MCFPKSNLETINCVGTPCGANTDKTENDRCCNQATCAQIDNGISGGTFSCVAGSSLKSNPETFNCGATPCAANSDATENARCCYQATCAQITDGVSGGPYSCAASTALKSNPETFYCDAMPCSANTNAAENA